jgi:hypothetical protein
MGRSNQLLACFVGMTFACGAVGCAPDQEVVTVNEAEAKENLARFKENGPASYVYVIQRTCDCANSGVWTRVVVEDDAVTSAVTASGDAVESGTMTDVLEGVVEWTLHDPLKFEATYEPELGYLLHLELDVSDTPSNEVELTIDCFGEGTTDDVCPLEEPVP